MNLKEKPSSNRGVVQRKVVICGRSIKDGIEEKSLDLIGVLQSVHSTISQKIYMDVP